MTDAPPSTLESNLPPAPIKGVFTVQTSIVIDAPIEAVWGTLLDFRAYGEWNPFVRSQVVTDERWEPLEDQTPQEGSRLLIKAHIPPLPWGPGSQLNAHTPSSRLRTQTSYEIVTALDAVRHRVAWRQVFIPRWLVDGERWQVLSVLPSLPGDSDANTPAAGEGLEEGGERGEGDGDGKRKARTYYETREVFGGVLAHIIRLFFGRGLQAGFDAQAGALKGRVEEGRVG